jgi:membrane protein implicated in regulation of membrane protease activity
MRTFRQIGSLLFVLGLFVAVFAGMPWYVVVADDPTVPWWLRTAVFSLLGGILIVLVTLAVEQRTYTPSSEEPMPSDRDRTVLLLVRRHCQDDGRGRGNGGRRGDQRSLHDDERRGECC